MNSTRTHCELSKDRYDFKYLSNIKQIRWDQFKCGIFLGNGTLLIYHSLMLCFNLWLFLLIFNVLYMACLSVTKLAGSERSLCSASAICLTILFIDGALWWKVLMWMIRSSLIRNKTINCGWLCLFMVSKPRDGEEKKVFGSIKLCWKLT